MQRVVYRFGRFALDTQAHCLFKDGERLPIQEQPFQVLLGLLECAGQVVLRETLHRRLWGNDTYVDFDQSLNSAVRRLRIVLGDDSRHPVYIETIPRTGFRFLPVVRVEGGELKDLLPLPIASPPPVTAVAAPVRLRAPHHSPSGARRFPLRSVASGLSVVMLSISPVLLLSHRHHVSAGQTRSTVSRSPLRDGTALHWIGR